MGSQDCWFCCLVGIVGFGNGLYRLKSMGEKELMYSLLLLFFDSSNLYSTI